MPAIPGREAEDCARQIFALVKDHGLRYNEIAVVSSEIELYGPLLQRAPYPSMTFRCFGI